MYETTVAGEGLANIPQRAVAHGLSGQIIAILPASARSIGFCGIAGAALSSRALATLNLGPSIAAPEA
jgi:hypothetical protein